VLPEQVRGSLLLEGIWTAIPTLTVLGLFLLTLATLSQVEGRARDGAAASAEPLSGPPGSITLDVTAFRWGWRFSFPDEGVTVSGATGEPVEVVLPVGRPVELRLTASDVNHAFYVPQFLFKRDAIPGRENRFTLHIEAAGTYRGQCAEFCGTYHSRMPFTIRAVAEAQFEAWLTERAGMASPETAP
jgi:cytochrome c oxidase subunit 2